MTADHSSEQEEGQARSPQRAATTASVTAEEENSLAMQMNGFLDELVPLIMAAPQQDQQMLQSAWTDARQDLLYVFSDGQLPTSLRLAHYVRGMGLDKNSEGVSGT